MGRKRKEVVDLSKEYELISKRYQYLPSKKLLNDDTPFDKKQSWLGLSATELNKVMDLLAPDEVAIYLKIQLKICLDGYFIIDIRDDELEIEQLDNINCQFFKINLEKWLNLKIKLLKLVLKEKNIFQIFIYKDLGIENICLTSSANRKILFEKDETPQDTYEDIIFNEEKSKKTKKNTALNSIKNKEISIENQIQTENIQENQQQTEPTWQKVELPQTLIETQKQENSNTENQTEPKKIVFPPNVLDEDLSSFFKELCGDKTPYQFFKEHRDLRDEFIKIRPEYTKLLKMPDETIWEDIEELEKISEKRYQEREAEKRANMVSPEGDQWTPKDEIYKPKRFNNIKDTKIRDESIDPSAKIVKALRDGTYDPKIHNCMGGKKRTAEEYIRDMELNEYFEKELKELKIQESREKFQKAMDNVTRLQKIKEEEERKKEIEANRHLDFSNNRRNCPDDIENYLLTNNKYNDFIYDFRQLNIEQLSKFDLENEPKLNYDYLLWRKKVAQSSGQFVNIPLNNFAGIENLTPNSKYRANYNAKSNHFYQSMFFQLNKQTLQEVLNNDIFPFKQNLMENGKTIKENFKQEVIKFLENKEPCEYYDYKTGSLIYIPIEKFPALPNLVLTEYSNINFIKDKNIINEFNQKLNDIRKENAELLDNNDYKINCVDYKYSPFMQKEELEILFKIPYKNTLKHCQDFNQEYTLKEYNNIMENNKELSMLLKIVMFHIMLLNQKFGTKNKRYINLTYLNKKLIDLLNREYVCYYDVLCCIKILYNASEEKLRDKYQILNEVRTNAGLVILAMLSHYENLVRQEAEIFDELGYRKAKKALNKVLLNNNEINEKCQKFGFDLINDDKLRNENQVSNIKSKISNNILNNNLTNDVSKISAEILLRIDELIQIGFNEKVFIDKIDFMVKNKKINKDFNKNLYYLLKSCRSVIKTLIDIDPIFKLQIDTRMKLTKYLEKDLQKDLFKK